MIHIHDYCQHIECPKIVSLFRDKLLCHRLRAGSSKSRHLGIWNPAPNDRSSWLPPAHWMPNDRFSQFFFWNNSLRTHTGFLCWRMTKSFFVQRQAFTLSFKRRKLEIVVSVSLHTYAKHASVDCSMTSLSNDVIEHMGQYMGKIPYKARVIYGKLPAIGVCIRNIYLAAPLICTASGR